MAKRRRLKLCKENKFKSCIADLYVVAEMKTEEVCHNFLPIPIFSGKNYEFWTIKMKTMLCAEGLLNFVEKECNGLNCVENECNESCDEASDASALYLIHQAMEDNVFHIVADATSAKEA